MKSRVAYYEYGVSGFLAVLIYNDERDQEVRKSGGWRDGFVDRADGTIVSVSASSEDIRLAGHPLTRARVERDCPELVKVAEAYVQRFVVPLVEMVKLPSGNLRILLRNRRAVQEIMDDPGHMKRNQGFLDSIEYWLANGWDVPSNGINCFYGLTDTMAITDEWCDDDDGMLVRDCRVYCYTEGWRYDEIEQLLAEGMIELEWFDAQPMPGNAWTDEEITAAQESGSWRRTQ